MKTVVRRVSNRYSIVEIIFSIDARAELDHAVNASTSRLKPDFSTEVSRKAFHGQGLAYHGNVETTSCCVVLVSEGMTTESVSPIHNSTNV